jgi:hypothetical protein
VGVTAHILGLEILVYLILEVFRCRLRNDALNAQAYNHTNPIIIRIWISQREEDVILRILAQESPELKSKENNTKPSFLDLFKNRTLEFSSKVQASNEGL